MKVLILSQVFHPDVVSVAQHTRDLARDMAAAGHEVTVLASRRAYDNPAEVYAARECWNGVDVVRVLGTGLGKKALWRRAIDFGSVSLRYLLRLMFMPRYDVVIALTVPPLVSFLGALFTRLRGGLMVLWVMDLNPDQAIAAGVLRPGSLVARALDAMLHYSLRSSTAIVVLDRFMKSRLVAKGVDASRIYLAPPWSHDTSVAYDPASRDVFRRTHALEDKYVVMYSGNHSPCHPLNTLLDSARRLAPRDDIAFVFVGGGTEHAKVASFARQHGLSNIRCLPYQPLDKLSGSLSSADLHVVVMGDPFVGIVHPCKVYNILQLGLPLLYIGPPSSHIADLAPDEAHGTWAFFARHGETDRVVAHIEQSAARGPRRSDAEMIIADQFSEAAIIPGMLRTIERAVQPMPRAIAARAGD